MKYLVYVKGSLDCQFDDSTKEELDAKVLKLVKKHGEDKVKIAKVPSNIGVGYEVYKDGKFYGTIVAESESLWHVKKPGSDIPNPFSKEGFETYFVGGSFDPIEDIDKELEGKLHGKRRRSSSIARDTEAKEGA